MQLPAIPENEAQRLLALKDTLLLDTPAEERFDRITRLARHLFGAKIALVSLVDAERQWFKSRQGLDACETGRDISFCGHAILEPDIFHIADARQDPRFADNPLVTGPPHIRFYVAAPLSAAHGQRIGTLCIIDDKPRQITAQERQALRDLADCVEEEINASELQLQKRALEQAHRLRESITRAQSQYIHQTDRRKAFDGLLADILALTDSEYGFIAEVLRTPSGDPYIKTYAVTNNGLNAATRAFYEANAAQGLAFYNLKSLYGAALTSGQPVIANNPAHDPRRGGTCEGHPPLKAFLGIPLFHAGEMVAMLALANRPAGYDQASIDFLEPLLVTIGQLVEATRIQDQYHKDQRELARLSQVASQTTNGVVITDAQGRVEWVNDGFTRISGYTLEDIQGRSPGELLQGEATDPATVAEIRAALRHQQAFSVDIVNYTKTGEPYWIRINCNPLRDSASHLLGFMAIESDITREKNDAERIRISEHRLAWVIDGTQMGVWEWNVQSGAIVINERWQEILGYGLAELEPFTLYSRHKLTHPEDLQAAETVLQQHFAGKLEYYDTLCRMRHKHGHWVWVRDRGRVVSWSEDGKPLMMYGSIVDITLRKLAEFALQDQVQHTQAILDNILDGIITIDQQGFIDSFNPAAERIFGYQASDILGKNVKLLMPHPHSDAHDNYLSKYHQTGNARVIGIGRELQGQRKDGSFFPIEVSVSEITRQGKPMYVGMVRDISERKRIERLQSEFVSTVSHELRTPLTALSGSLSLIASGTLGELNAQIQQLLDIAGKNSQRLTHLINDLLDIEKLTAGKMHFDMQAHALIPLIEQALQTNRTYGTEQQVTLLLTSRDSDATVMVDEQRLMQVLSNLLSNAIKFSPQGGSVEISVITADNRATVTVTDHGTGIPAEYHSRIFQKFSQADASDTRQKGGTGLGLAITKELVERMGGEIGFSSVQGKGASFFFELPLCTEVETTSRQAHSR